MGTHVMIDLETFGTNPDTAFISIGAVKFNPMNGQIAEDTFYKRIDWEDALKHGTITASTLAWWMQQSKEARDEILKPGERLDLVLTELKQYLGSKPIVWGNGASFDISILEHHYRASDIPVPWAFWDIRDVRTVVDLAAGIVSKADVPQPKVAHNALHDAMYQAAYVSKMWQALRK